MFTCVCSKELLQSQSGLCVNMILECGVTGYSVIVAYFTAGTVNNSVLFCGYHPVVHQASSTHQVHTHKRTFSIFTNVHFFCLETRTRRAVARSDVYELLHVCAVADVCQSNRH